MINRENKDINSREITTLLLLGILSIPVMMGFISVIFPTSLLMGLLHYLSMALVVATFTGALILYNKSIENKWDITSLTASDYYTIFKFSFIGFSLSSNSFICVAALLFYEKLPYAEEGSSYRTYNDDIENCQYYITKLWYYIKQPLAILSYISMVELIAISPAMLILLSDWKIPMYLSPIFDIVLWSGYYYALRYSAELVGGSWKSLFYLPTKDVSAEGHPYGSHTRNFKWMLIAFLIASPTIILNVLFPGFLFVMIDLSCLSHVQYVVYSILHVLYFSIQPMVEEIIFRVLFYRYCVLEKLCPEDYKEMDLTQQVLYSLLNSSLFAFMHQIVRCYNTVSSFIPLMCMGFLSSMLTFLNGNINLTTFNHAFHNISCTLFPGFLGFWYKAGYEFTRYMTPFLSESLKYATVVTLEDDFCNSEIKEYRSKLDVVREMFAQYIPAF